MAFSRFSFPTLIHFGPGVRAQLGDYLKSNNVKRPLVVTDKGVAGLPIYAGFLSDLKGKGFAAEGFSGVVGNPVKSQVSAGVEAFRSHGADAVIGFGGGAALDVAKAIALMVHHPGDLFDYEDEKPGARPIDKEIPFFVALPTTSGTGSEVGRSSVVSDDQTHLKKIIFSPRLLAKAVFADPELTYDLPAKMTAATGMDALTHCVEAYLAKAYHPLCDGIAMEGVRISAGALVKCVREPKSVQARSDMMMASMMGAIAFQKGLGLTHSCAHALSTVVDMHHGLANGIMIDHALKFYVPTVPERFAAMATTIGLPEMEERGSRAGGSGRDRAGSDGGFIRWLGRLKSDCGIPSKLSEAGVKREHLEKLADVAIADACHPSGPRAPSRDDFARIFAEAL